MAQNMQLRVLMLGDEVLEELVLPELHAKDTFSFVLDHDSFDLEADVEVFLEEMGGFWTFVPNDAYEVRMDSEDFTQRAIKAGQVVRLMVSSQYASRHNAGVYLHICPAISSLVPSTHYHWGNNVSRVSMGVQGNGDYDIALSKLNGLGYPRATITRSSVGWILTDESAVFGDNGPAPLYVNKRRVHGSVTLVYGDVLDAFDYRFVCLGEIFVALHTSGRPLQCFLAKLKPMQIRHIASNAQVGEGDMLFKRAPRMVVKHEDEPIEIEAPPALNNTKGRKLIDAVGPSLTMILPMMAGTVLAGTGNPFGVMTMGASSLVMALWATKGVRDQKKEAHAAEERRFNRYREYVQDRERMIEKAYNDSRVRLLQDYPSAEECLSLQNQQKTLWNRNQYDDDYLFLRLGIGNRAFERTITIPKEKFSLEDDVLAMEPARVKDKFSILNDVPVGIDLSCGVFGIIGGRWLDGCRSVINVLLAQLATSYSYRDFKIALICDRRYSFDRKLIKVFQWLPHVWDETHEFRYIGDDQQSVREVLGKLTAIADSRSDENGNSNMSDNATRYAVFVSHSDLIDGSSFSEQVLKEDANKGFSVFLCAEDYASLPNACRHVIQCTEGFNGTFQVTDDPESWCAIDFDYVSDDQLVNLARNISPLRLQSPEKEAGVPDVLTFLQLFGANTIQDLHMAERWRTNTGFTTLAAEVGMGAGGVTCTLDVHERADGPHGLVAGTTGSGKSETLMTWIGSLAVNYSPDEVTFLLIDFKGGGLVNQFVNPDDISDRLPHIVGIITNLSGNQIHRALVSIKSENERRQRMLTKSGANDVYDYARLYRSGQAKKPMPHLMIVSDEFAELKKQYPDFMGELVSVAAIGRSLGVHLVLATQQPSGVVDDKISTNSRFRLCLKVQTTADSRDMLNRPDAAFITQKGRGYLRVGHDERLDLFQSAWSRAPYSTEGKVIEPTPAALISITGQTILKAPKLKKKKESEPKTTQLDEVIKCAQRTVGEGNYNLPRALWLPDLKKALALEELDMRLDVPAYDEGECAVCVPIGMYDDPAHQYQGTVWVDFIEYGHYAICGEQGSGKSVFLQTMLMSLMRAYSPDELNIYCVDYSNNMLRSLEGAPQVGDVVPEGDKESVEKLFYMLDGLVSERRELLSGSSFSAYKTRHPHERVPAVIVAIDQYGAFRDKTDQLYDDRIVSLARDGATLGIFFVVTAAGIGSSDIPNKLMGQIRGRLCLAMSDEFAYRDLLGVDRCEVLPTSGISGRGLARVKDEALEFQTALVAGAQDDTTRNNAVANEIATLQTKYAEFIPAPHIPKVPDDPKLSEFMSHPKVEAMMLDDVSLPVGYDMTSAEPTCIRLDQFFCYLVSGKLKSGTTEFLCALLRMASQKGDARIHVIGAGRTAVQRVAEECGATYHPAGEDLFPYFSQEFTQEVMTRNKKKHDLEMNGVEENELFEAMADEDNYFMFFEDFAAFINMVYSPDGMQREYPRVFETFFSRGWYHRMYMICCVDQARMGTASSTAIYKLATQDGAGMHFGGRSSRQNTLSFDWLASYKEGDKLRPPGVGMAASGEFCVGHGMVAIPDYRR